MGAEGLEAGRADPGLQVAPAPEAVGGMGDRIHRKASTEARTAAATTDSDTAAGMAGVAGVEMGVGVGVIAGAGVGTTNSPTIGSRSIAPGRRRGLCSASLKT